MTGAGFARRPSLFRTSPRDGAVLAAALVLGGMTALLAVALAAAPPSPAQAAAAALLLAGAVCWGSNTVAHIHLHTPLFRARVANRLFSLYLTLLLRIPQTLWRARHLAHHHPARSGRRPRTSQETAATVVELALVAALTGTSAILAPTVLAVFAAGQLLGLGLCFLQGHFEHRGRADGVDHHGRIYNRLWFNDGYHSAHHRWPGQHWTTIPTRSRQLPAGVASRWPPLLRWLEGVTRSANRWQAAVLDQLERLALRSRLLRRFLVAAHRRSFQPLLAQLSLQSPLQARRVRIGVVGGGLFPRTVLVLRELLPEARLAIIDSNPRHLEQARAQLGSAADVDVDEVELIAASFDAAADDQRFDVVVIPLAYRGDREGLYATPPAPITLIHDWVWRRRGHDGRRISWLLLKRLNLVLS